jgi:RNA polymerase sigma-70 factor (ECF subfamily)
MKKARQTSENRTSPSQGEFEKFYNDNYRAVSRYIARRVPASSFDGVVAATFVAAWRKLTTVPSPSLAWLYRIAHYEVVREWQVLGRHPQTVELNDLDLIDTAPLEEVLDVSKAFSQLSDIDAELLRLVYWEDLSRSEIAEVLGLSVNAVNVRHHRALDRLSGALNRLSSAARADQPTNPIHKEKP